MKDNMLRPVWAEVDLHAIACNIRAVRKIVDPQVQIMAIVKANAYGHGAVQIARTVLNNGADRLGVATLGEALELRKDGFTAPILLLGYIPEEHISLALEYDITLVIYTREMAEAVSRIAGGQKKTAVIHLKIDTGMGRIGFLPGQKTIAEIKKICSLPDVFVEGILTHFSAADARDKTVAHKQFQIFMELIDQLKQEGVEIPIKHAANSGAIIDLPETHLDMVRPGIILYGHYPSGEVNDAKLPLIPAMTLKARVSYVKKVPAGSGISYGHKHVTKDEAVIASLPLGYADGYTRMLSNKVQVLLGGERVPEIGSICMDQFMVDASKVPEIKIGDEAVLFGGQGEEYITVEEIAEKLNTINYEILCMLSERIPRVYLNEE